MSDYTNLVDVLAHRDPEPSHNGPDAWLVVDTYDRDQRWLRVTVGHHPPGVGDDVEVFLDPEQVRALTAALVGHHFTG